MDRQRRERSGDRAGKRLRQGRSRTQGKKDRGKEIEGVKQSGKQRARHRGRGRGDRLNRTHSVDRQGKRQWDGREGVDKWKKKSRRDR